MTVDCSYDSPDGNVKAKDFYDSHKFGNAVYLNLNLFINLNVRPYLHRTPTVEEFKEHMMKLGVGVDTPVVCYDNAWGLGACRGAFLLSVFGVRTVKILNCHSTEWQKM